MKVKELRSLYSKGLQICETKETLQMWNDNPQYHKQLDEYPSKYQFYAVIPKEILDIPVPFSNLTSEGTLVKECTFFTEIAGKTYIRMCIYNAEIIKTTGNYCRTLPIDEYELRKWMDACINLEIVKELPTNLEL